MIEALYQLGKYYNKNYSSDSEIEEIIENPNENGKYNNVLKIKFKYKNNKIEYEKVELEEFSIKKLINYLYKRGGGNAGDYTPTSRVTEFNRTLKNLLKSIIKIDTDIFKNINNYLSIKKNYKTILNDLNSYNPKDGYILTLNINNKNLNEFPEIMNLLYDLNNSKYYKKFGKISKANNKYCFICKEDKKEVYGFVNTYNFYTVNENGFISGGFEKENTWKNYPVCPNCANLLEKGKKYIEQKFYDSFAGFQYMIIPRTIFELKNNDDLIIFERLLNQLESENKICLSEKRKNELFSNENFSLQAMSKIDNRLIFNIVFFKEDKAAFNILMNIEDILPSRLIKLFDIKGKIESFNIFNQMKYKDDYIDLSFNFKVIRDFFPNNKIEGNWDKNFLEIINSIFINKKIDYQFIISNFLRIIRKKFINEEPLYFDVRKSLMILKYFYYLDLLKNLKGGICKTMEENNIYNSFFKEHSEVFDSDAKKGIFLEGMLVQKLLNLPEQQSKSFYSRLNSLKLNENNIKRILVESINKLNEYDKNYYKDLEKNISLYLTNSNFKEITNDEISYFFVLGMNLADKFKFEKEKKEE